ncbi:oligosaccharide flippase family protein [Xenorhabdus hominickii]|uniref:O-unit flippase n=1 Tax=Xenorhabdus hominickii TaxID=351679 RepID=A0A2G0QEM6_XENHO|nr:oligosaccharide flippase family protein [Xenorhabdus hominickii]AOM41728.1 hypothetical protein A9255_14875 [Xenorhabdus hominickii]PHM57685.1 O-unit flippase [Xenorhabdus hominickii]
MKSINSNSIYLVIEKSLRFFNGIIATALTARYLGAENIGYYNYNIAIIMLLTPIVMLGFRDILITKIKEKHFNHYYIVLSTLSSFIVSTLIYIIIIMYEKNSHGISILEISPLKILGFILILLSFEPSLSLLISHEKSKFILLAGLLQTIISITLKVLLVYYKGNIVHLCMIYLIENLIYYFICTASAIFLFKNKKTNIKIKRLFKAIPKFYSEIFSSSINLMISGFMISAYMRIDIFMIEHYSNLSSVGIYSTAVRLIEAIYFIPSMYVLGSFPNIIENLKNKNFIACANISKILLLSSMVFIIFYQVVGDDIIDTLFGINFREASDILKIYSLVVIITFQGFLIEKIILLKHGSKVILIAVFLGLILNIIMNMVFIPIYGIKGAAYSTIACQSISYFAYYLFNKKTRNTIFSIYQNYSK